MNYKALFTDSDALQGAGFSCTLYRSGMSAHLDGAGRFPAVFVLAGQLSLSLDGQPRVFSAGEMILLDRLRLTGSFCAPGTVVLEYTLPEALDMLLGHSFTGSCTPAVPVTGRLETWVEELFFSRNGNGTPGDRLVGLLIRYQSHRLRAVMAPMRAYAAKRDCDSGENCAPVETLKEQVIDYRALFRHSETLDGGENFCCLCYRERGATRLECGSVYPMLMVLQGGLDMSFGYNTCRIEAGQIVVIDTAALTRYSPAAGTIVLAYRPPQRLSGFFHQCTQTFRTSFSQIVPILPPLWQWIDARLTEYARGIRHTGEAAHEQRRELARIFTAYPRRFLGELYAPFTVCAMGDCDRCREGVPVPAEMGGGKMVNNK